MYAMSEQEGICVCSRSGICTLIADQVCVQSPSIIQVQVMGGAQDPSMLPDRHNSVQSAFSGGKQGNCTRWPITCRRLR